MNDDLPSIIVTGASGFIGRYFLDVAKTHYRIYAIGRRSREAADVPYHANIRWIQCDIADGPSVESVMHYIKEHDGASALIHLAAFYNLTYDENPEYQRTNVTGTKHVLELARGIGVDRFVFASSLVACEFPDKGGIITEQSPPDAVFAYARTKREGERLVREYTKWFPCSVVRLAAVFSDWCEYGPLYRFLQTWCSGRWDARILAGKGDSAVPYIHVHDLVRLFLLLLSKSATLPGFDVYAATPDGATTHRELFDAASSYYFGAPRKPVLLPKAIVGPGIAARRLLHRLYLTPEEPFERLWMVKYIDRALTVDASYTRKTLSWKPTPRYHVQRRLLSLIERMKAHPGEWRLRNEAAMKRVARRPGLMIYEGLTSVLEDVRAQITRSILSAEHQDRFIHYARMNPDDLQGALSTILHLLMASVRSGDRRLMVEYVDDIVLQRFADGFPVHEVCNALSVISDVVTRELISKGECDGMRQEVHDHIGITMQLAQDEVEDVYERLEEDTSRERVRYTLSSPAWQRRGERIRRLSARYEAATELDQISDG